MNPILSVYSHNNDIYNFKIRTNDGEKSTQQWDDDNEPHLKRLHPHSSIKRRKAEEKKVRKEEEVEREEGKKQGT